MTLSENQIEWIVREVLRRLTENRAASPAAGGNGKQRTASGVTTGSQAAAKRTTNCLELTERLITLAVLDGRTAGITSVVVSPKAVVTPAVRDELRKQKIALHRGVTATAASQIVVLIDTHIEKDEAAAKELAGQWNQAGLVARQFGGALPRLIDELTAAVPARRLTILLTSQVPAAVCAANRRRGVRAVAAVEAVGNSAVEAIGANVVVMDPAAWDRTAAVAFGEQLAAAGWRECPPALRGVLN